MGARYPLAFPWQAPPAEHVDSYGEHVQVLIEERQELMWHHQLCQSNPNFPRELPCIVPFTFRQMVLYQLNDECVAIFLRFPSE